MFIAGESMLKFQMLSNGELGDADILTKVVSL